MTDKPGVTREELMAMREVAAKAWRQALGDERRESLAAYLDREYPLPKEPPITKAPSGRFYRVMRAPYTGHQYEVRAWDSREKAAAATTTHMDGNWHDCFPVEDLATVANLLVPFEDVVRATLEEMEVVQVVMERVGSTRYYGSEHPLKDWNGFADKMTAGLPAILKRLSR